MKRSQLEPALPEADNNIETQDADDVLSRGALLASKPPRLSLMSQPTTNARIEVGCTSCDER